MVRQAYRRARLSDREWRDGVSLRVPDFVSDLWRLSPPDPFLSMVQMKNQGIIAPTRREIMEGIPYLEGRAS